MNHNPEPLSSGECARADTTAAQGHSLGRVLLLATADNVLVAAEDLNGGTAVRPDGITLILPVRVPLGHKLARRAIRTGEKIVKHGAPIGTATADIVPGGHVHLHNLASDYLATASLTERH